MIATQLRDKAKWLVLCLLGLSVYVMFSEIRAMGNCTLDLVDVGLASKRDLAITAAATPAPTTATPSPTTAATPAPTTSVAAGQRRVVRASAVYPIDQAHTSPCQLDSALRQVVVIRTCGLLTPELRASYSKYAQELSASPDYDLWLIHDTGGTKAAAAEANEDMVLTDIYDLQREHPGLGLFVYSTKDVKALLPTAAFLQEDKTPNFWFHDASLFLWSITCRPDLWQPTPASREKELCIWTVEQDAIYFGDLSRFLDEHTTNTADYIADYRKLQQNWSHWDHSTWRPPYDKALFKKQHVERHSTALLRFLYSITLLDVVAYGEIFASTVCAMQPHWCVMAPLERRFIGSAYSCSSFLTDEQVADMWNDPAEQGKWNHAVVSRKSTQCKSALRVYLKSANSTKKAD